MLRSLKKIGEILIDKGLVRPEELDRALQEQARTKEFLGKILIKRCYVKESDLLSALSEQFQIPILNLKEIKINWDFVKSFNLSLIFEFKCFPIQQDEWSVTIAITNPLDMWAIKKCEEEVRGLRLKLALVSMSDIAWVIEEYKKRIAWKTL